MSGVGCSWDKAHRLKQLRFGAKAKQQTCLNCPSFEKFVENIGYCRKYNFEVWLSLAGKVKVCRDFELHHVMPTGKLTPTKRKKEANKPKKEKHEKGEQL